MALVTIKPTRIDTAIAYAIAAHTDEGVENAAEALTVIDERFADQRRREASDCEREAERTVNPLDKEAWLRLSRGRGGR